MAIVLAVIFGVWIGAWIMATEPIFKSMTSQPLADMFSSINALFAGLAFAGVIITVYYQIYELKDTREELKRTADSSATTARAAAETAAANLKMVAHSDEQAILDLFKIYCSEYFQTVKDSSMSVLIPCVASKKYYDFVVTRFFVAEQMEFPADCWEKVSKATYCKDFDDFLKSEQRYRYKLDELINFFTLLTGKSNSKEIIARCDFSYSWWRPLFWMIAMGQEQRYASNEQVRKYGTAPYFMAVTRKLDEIYGLTPFKTNSEAWEFIINHPKVKHYGIDSEFIALIQGQ
ncbi:hypothetical protein [Paraburkholderia caffeinilytica]|uniref:hypothetical protein n=1 Tax=Paraburkholderia caffeinilytica TaxID=1761016 RepID=UPI0038BD5084